MLVALTVLCTPLQPNGRENGNFKIEHAKAIMLFVLENVVEYNSDSGVSYRSIVVVVVVVDVFD